MTRNNAGWRPPDLRRHRPDLGWTRPHSVCFRIWPLCNKTHGAPGNDVAGFGKRRSDSAFARRSLTTDQLWVELAQIRLPFDLIDHTPAAFGSTCGGCCHPCGQEDWRHGRRCVQSGSAGPARTLNTGMPLQPSFRSAPGAPMTSDPPLGLRAAPQRSQSRFVSLGAQCPESFQRYLR